MKIIHFVIHEGRRRTRPWCETERLVPSWNQKAIAIPTSSAAPHLNGSCPWGGARQVNGGALAGDEAVPVPASLGKPVVEGLPQGRDGTGARAIRERILAQRDAAEDLPGAAALLVGGDEAVTADDDPPVRRVPAAVSGTVGDEVRAQVGRVHADAELGEPVVPCDVGAFPGLERVDGQAP